MRRVLGGCAVIAEIIRCGSQDLSWEDREKVLRLLFAKINNQAQQVHLSNLPQHSFAPEQEQEYLPLPAAGMGNM